MCSGGEAGEGGDNGPRGRFSSDRLLPRRDPRLLGAMTVPTGRISLKEESLDCQRADRIQGEGSNQRSTSIEGSTKVGPR